MQGSRTPWTDYILYYLVMLVVPTLAWVGLVGTGIILVHFILGINLGVVSALVLILAVYAWLISVWRLSLARGGAELRLQGLLDLPEYNELYKEKGKKVTRAQDALSWLRLLRLTNAFLPWLAGAMFWGGAKLLTLLHWLEAGIESQVTWSLGLSLLITTGLTSLGYTKLNDQFHDIFD